MEKPSKKGYNFDEIEPKIKEFWEKEGIFDFDPKKGKVYSVDTPPPTVSGAMHIGHAFSYAQQDFIVRYRRMKEGVFYPFGTDDNGLPTERLVERLKKVKSKEMSRAEFTNLCLNTLKEITPNFIESWKRIGVSADFNLCYSTIDDNSRKISQESFIELFEKGHIYKKNFPTLWCPECQTSIAQAELEDKEKSTFFTTLKFESGGEDLLIATTRPELLGACVAVFVNPKDSRYKDFVGKTAKVPLYNLEVPIIKDESADPEKGTGVLMICSYGDKFDVDAIERHKLEPRVIFDTQGKITQGSYEGFGVEKARKIILEDLKKAKLIEKQDSISHVVNVHDKCGTPIEFIPTKQWFIKVVDKKKELISQGKKINWKPEHMFKRYENWIEGLEWDWNISRDRHFGIPIPVWECISCEEMIVPKKNELPIDPLQIKKKCPSCNKEATAETKVLDTWATSSLTPRIAASLTMATIKSPESLRPQAHDIIRTWAFYTIVKSYLHENTIPWKDIVISGNVSLKGEKMSKSKGNVIDPQDILEKYGADPLRFWASGSKLGEDMDYQEQDLVAGKKTVTKLFNATKFVFMNLEDYDFKKPKKLEKMDEEFLKQLDFLTSEVTKNFEDYNYSMARMNAEKFFWGDFADNYIEIVKKRVYQGEGNAKKSAQYTLYTSLLTLLKLYAPIIPFVTEELYLQYFRQHEKEASIHLASWPTCSSKAKPSEDFKSFVLLLGKIRQSKTNAKKSMNSEVIIVLPKEELVALKGVEEDFMAVTNAKELKAGTFKVEFI